MTKHFKAIKFKLHTNSQIIIRHAWRLYKRRKAIKAEKKKQRELAAKAKKRGKYGGVTRQKQSVAPVNPLST